MLRALTVLLALLAGPAVLAQDPPQVVKLGVRPGGKQPRAFRYTLLPAPLDRTAGNAAPLWVRAGCAVRTVKGGIGTKEDQYLAAPLDNFPCKQVSAVLEKYRTALRLAEQAARCRRCEWELPPLTIQRLQDLPLDEVQGYRLLVYVLHFQFRLHLSQGDYDQALRTLQTEFALARDLGTRDTMIDQLVAMALEAIALGQVQEWIKQPGSPNLYWALTALPRPFIDLRRNIENELNTVYRSFPGLARLRKGPVPAAEVRSIVEEVFTTLGKFERQQVPDWVKEATTDAFVARVYPDARRHLLDRGHEESELRAMPKLQVVVLHFMEQYDRTRDDVLKWMSVPPWQRREGLGQVQKEVQAASGPNGNYLLKLLMPAFEKVAMADLRLQRHVAGMRGAEALRLHAVTHRGKAPAKWSDLRGVPEPTDPVTGKGLDDFYQVKDGKAVLYVPPPPGQPLLLGRRYELPATR